MRLGLTPIHLELTLEQVEHLRDSLKQRIKRLEERRDKTPNHQHLEDFTRQILASIETQLFGE